MDNDDLLEAIEWVNEAQNKLQGQDLDDEDELPREVQQDIERLSRLYQERDITKEEYQLLKYRVLNDVDGDKHERSTNISDDKNSNIADWLPDDKLQKVTEAYWQLIPNTDDPYQEDTSYDNFVLEISALPDDSAVSPGFYSSPPSCVFAFTKRQQENQLRERVKNIESHKISLDLTDVRPPQVVVDFDLTSGEIREDFSEEDIRKIIDNIFQTVIQTYNITRSDISNGDIDIKDMS